jgi:DNA-binding response OmpR family regulator
MSSQIVVFENAPNLRLLYDIVLTTHGYRVFTFEEDETSLQRVHALRPDLIILGNIRVDTGEAFHFLNQLRFGSDTQALPVVIATTAPPTFLQSSGLEEDASVCILYKPFEPQQLLACVELMLSKGKQQADISERRHGRK